MGKFRLFAAIPDPVNGFSRLRKPNVKRGCNVAPSILKRKYEKKQ
jgi:hypothetical protein